MISVLTLDARLKSLLAFPCIGSLSFQAMSQWKAEASRARLLVADDEPNLLSNLVFAFEAEGYAVEGRSDGEQAWEAFRSLRPDLVILDIMMPRADGPEVLRRIRSLDTEVPVMFLTSKDEEFDKVLGLELGADDYLTKPFSRPAYAPSSGVRGAAPRWFRVACLRPFPSSHRESSSIRSASRRGPRVPRCGSPSPSSGCWQRWSPPLE